MSHLERLLEDFMKLKESGAPAPEGTNTLGDVLTAMVMDLRDIYLEMGNIHVDLKYMEKQLKKQRKEG